MKVKLFIIVCLSVLLYIYAFDKKIDVNGDNVKYYLLGKSIAQGNGYSSIWLPVPEKHNHFPIGYPAIIAAFMKMGVKSITGIKIVNFLFLQGTIIFLFLLILKITNQTVAFISASLVAVNSHLLRYSTTMMSEMSYIFFSVLTIYLVSKIDFKRPLIKNYHLFFAIITLTISYYIRGVGIALAVGVFLYFVFLKQWKYLITTVSGFVLLYLPNITSSSGYLASLQYKNLYRVESGEAGILDYLSRISYNCARYFYIEIPKTFLPFIEIKEFTIAGYVVGLIATSLVVLTMVRLMKQRSLITIYFLCTLFILLLWPEQWVGVRFLLPLFVFIIFSIVYGLYMVFNEFKLNPKYLYGIIVIYILFHANSYHKLHQFAQSKLPANWYTYFLMADWVKHNTESDDVFIARKESLFYLESNRKAYRYKFTTDPQEMIADFEEKNVDYVVLDGLGFSSTSRYLRPVIEKHPERFEKVCKISRSRTTLYKFRKTEYLSSLNGKK